MNDDFDPAKHEQQLQQLHHAPATARVPEAVGHGVFATGVIILTNPNEVVLDFVQGISNPRRVAARVVLAHAVAAQFAAALEGNIARYTANFGPPRMPSPPQQAQQAPQVVIPPTVSPPNRPPESSDAPPDESADAASAAQAPAAAPAPAQPPIADIYEQIRLADDMVGGAYANVVAISHTPAEFCFDFIASVYPRSAVTARVYLAAPRAVEALASLRRSLTPRQPPG